jgi:hypothetical protein
MRQPARRPSAYPRATSSGNQALLTADAAPLSSVDRTTSSFVSELLVHAALMLARMLLEQRKGFIDGLSETTCCGWNATQVRRHHLPSGKIVFAANSI